MGHGDADGVVTRRDGAGRQSVSLCPQHDGQPFLRQEPGVFNADGVIAQRHGSSTESQVPQAPESRIRPLGRLLPDPGPRDLEDGAHAHPHRPAVERIAAGGRHQHRVHVQRRRGAEDGADVGGVHDPLQHCDPAGICAQLLHAGEFGAAHSAQYAPGQGIAGQLRQQLPGCGIDRNIGAAGKDAAALSGELAVLHQQRDRLIPGIQRPLNDLGALRNEDPLLRLQPVAQLRLRQSGKGLQLRHG